MRAIPGGYRVAALTGFVVLVAACGGGGGDEQVDATTTTTTVEPTPTSTTTIVPVGPIMPLTGLAADGGDLEAGAVAVKIGNNNSDSRPQTGLIEADLVYEAMIEAQKTRFIAVFHSTIPTRVGPVRSGRTGDLDLLAGLGEPGFAFSGGNSTVLGVIRAAVNRNELVDVGAIRREGSYERIDDRRAPYNLYFNAAAADDIRGLGAPMSQFVHGDLPADLGRPIGGVQVTCPTSSGRQSTHLWDPEVAGWVRVQDGVLHTAIVDGGEVEIAPANVVVALVTYGVSAADPQTPEPQTFGTGPVQVFTQGREVQGTWTRTEDNPVWDLRAIGGEPVPIAPGPTWVLLVVDADSRFSAGAIATFSQADALSMLADARAAVKMAAS